MSRSAGRPLKAESERLQKIYRECHAKGMTISETAREAGVYPAVVSAFGKRHNIKFTPAELDTTKARAVSANNRRARTIALYKPFAEAGKTMRETAQELGVTHQAVSQAARRYNLKFVSNRERLLNKMKDLS